MMLARRFTIIAELCYNFIKVNGYSASMTSIQDGNSPHTAPDAELIKQLQADNLQLSEQRLVLLQQNLAGTHSSTYI